MSSVLFYIYHFLHVLLIPPSLSHFITPLCSPCFNIHVPSLAIVPRSSPDMLNTSSSSSSSSLLFLLRSHFLLDHSFTLLWNCFFCFPFLLLIPFFFQCSTSCGNKGHFRFWIHVLLMENGHSTKAFPAAFVVPRLPSLSSCHPSYMLPPTVYHWSVINTFPTKNGSKACMVDLIIFILWKDEYWRRPNMGIVVIYLL